MNLTKALLAVALILPFTVSAQVTMESIEFSQLPGDKIEIKMNFDEAPPAPTGYTIEQPARIALDLVDVSSALSQKVHPLGGGNARTVTVVEAGDRTRVIVALTDLTGYTTRVEGNSLFVFVGEQNQGGLVSQADRSQVIREDAPTLSAGGMAAAGQSRVEEIDFRRGENGEGRVIVRLSDTGAGVDVSSEGGNIRVAFSDVDIPISLQRRLDVTDFATPVLTVDALPEGDDTVILVEPTGDYDYLAYQADDVFTLEVKSLTADELEAQLDERFLYRGEKLSLNFQDIEIRAVLQLIADFTDLNLVTSDTVAGRITLRLKNVPWDQALDIIMKTKGLDKRQVGNVLMVAPAAELAAREKLELENRQQVSELAPLRTEFIEVRYAKAVDLLELFQGAGTGGEGGEGGGAGNTAGNFLSARGSVIVDERTNSIIITDTVEKINDLRELLEKLDVPVRQVMIEARIVEINTNAQQDLGIKWGLAGRGVYDNGDLATQVGPNLTSVAAIRQSQVDGTSLVDANPLQPDGGLTVDFGSGGTSNFAIGFLADNFLLDLELNALETEGKSEVISRPRVITADKQAAHIEQGAQVPFEQATSSGATAVTFASATLALDVTPQITPDDRVLLELSVTNDSIGGAASNGQPIINTNRVETNVLVSNGETLVLGGIFQVNSSTTSSRTPFFGDLPMVGSLFRRNSENNTKSEILIFITPRLIRDSVTGR